MRRSGAGIDEFCPRAEKGSEKQAAVLLADLRGGGASRPDGGRDGIQGMAQMLGRSGA